MKFKKRLMSALGHHTPQNWIYEMQIYLLFTTLTLMSNFHHEDFGLKKRSQFKKKPYLEK